MKGLPTPEAYEQEFQYMPWGLLIEKVIKLVVELAPQGGSIVDLMCGPGYLLGRISQKREDLCSLGVDISPEFIRFASLKYPEVKFIEADVLEWHCDQPFEMVLCTGGLHHIPFERQEELVQRMASLLKPNGLCILADAFIAHLASFSNETERRLAAAKLGYEYLKAVLQNKAPDDIVATTIDIMYNDVLLKGEYKTSIERFKQMAEPVFNIVSSGQTWPRDYFEQRSYGDYYFIMQRPQTQLVIDL